MKIIAQPKIKRKAAKKKVALSHVKKMPFRVKKGCPLSRLCYNQYWIKIHTNPEVAAMRRSGGKSRPLTFGMTVM